MERLNWDMASKDERRVSSCSFPWRGAGGVMRNTWVRIRPGHLRVETMTSTRSSDVTGGRQQAGT